MRPLCLLYLETWKRFQFVILLISWFLEDRDGVLEEVVFAFLSGLPVMCSRLHTIQITRTLFLCIRELLKKCDQTLCLCAFVGVTKWSVHTDTVQIHKFNEKETFCVIFRSSFSDRKTKDFTVTRQRTGDTDVPHFL